MYRSEEGHTNEYRVGGVILMIQSRGVSYE